MKRFAFLFLMLASLPASGCSSLSAGLGFRDFAVFQDYSIENRNRNEAYKAWKRAKWDYWRQGVPHYLCEHIGRGFQQGYVDAAAGGGQQVPYFPPRFYWGTNYQSPRGSEMIAAWFRGYQDGAMAGEQSGLARYVTLPSSSSVPMPNGGQTQQENKSSNGPFDFLPPDFMNDTEAVPTAPPVPSKLNEILPAPALPAPQSEPPKLQPPPVPGKQTSTPADGTKPAVIPAAPILEADAGKTKSADEVRK